VSVSGSVRERRAGGKRGNGKQRQKNRWADLVLEVFHADRLDLIQSQDEAKPHEHVFVLSHCNKHGDAVLSHG
jgi:hypothetical protein